MDHMNWDGVVHTLSSRARTKMDSQWCVQSQACGGIFVHLDPTITNKSNKMNFMEKYGWDTYKSMSSLKYKHVSTIDNLIARQRGTSYWFTSTFTGSIFPIEQVIPAAVRVLRTAHVKSVLFCEEDFREYNMSDLIDVITSSTNLERVQFYACRFSPEDRAKILEIGRDSDGDFYEVITIDVRKLQWDLTTSSVPVELGGVAHVVHAWMSNV